ncbi:hypothetical protein D9Q98_000062 [Chlorella vulgaris]|uniref:Xaa-Pro dipeptidase n=1 Tax=Chlorella vulgaris TaxID=3077 RepID=A0A9D4TXP2_CHLVU|nr:hypothetical protein D9Q98_000062 [Chlorella vulgaris]
MGDVYRLGRGLGVPRGELHHDIRTRFLHRFRQLSGLPLEDMGVVVLQGGSGFPLYNSDNEMLFRQEAYFQYMFGVNDLQGWYGAFDIRTGRAFLFMPRLPASYAVWMGHILRLEEAKAKYSVDEVRYVDELSAVLAELAPPCLHTLDGGINSDSGLPMPAVSFAGIEQFTVEARSLHPVLTECRVFKTPAELAVMQYACSVASAAHVAVMQGVKPGMFEFQAESLYLHKMYSQGCRGSHYTPIFASGSNAAILHYGHAGAPNSRQMQASELLLVDAGAEYYRYAADITTTFPVGGTFTPDQALIYNAVLAASRAVIAAMKPGVRWPDMHLLAERTILAALQAAGLLAGDLEAMLEARLGAVFMPHGLGHFLGLDTHDVGGYQPGGPERPQGAGISRLRTARVLEAGMVITVEPGCYFTRVLLEPAFVDPLLGRFLVEERLRQFMDFGGVRIEDDVLVTADGAQTMCDVPRTVEEVEAVMGGAPWPLDR